MEKTNYIKSINVSKNSIQVKHGDVLNPYLIDDYYVEYESKYDLSKLDEGVLVIPFVLATIHIIWCSGKIVTIDRLEEKFSKNLSKLKDEFGKMYPNLELNGNVIVKNEISVETGEGIDGLLFSGGLDSIHSAFSHPDSKLIFTVWGADTDPDDAVTEWQYLKTHSQSFAERFKHTPVFIRSNFRSFLNEPELHTWHSGIPHWYSYIQHGAGLIGLCAPILIIAHSTKLYIASSNVEGQGFRGWGSTRASDESIQFANCKVIHDGFDKSRQDKTTEIVDYSRKNNLNGVNLMVCTTRISGGQNCSICEKCLRTSIGLSVEGEDPQNWGFNKTAIETLKLYKQKYQTLRLNMINKVFIYEQIQKRIKELNYTGELKYYMDWLSKRNFNFYAKISNLISGRFIYYASPRFLRKLLRKFYFLINKKKQ
jgi:hypothetical protein